MKKSDWFAKMNLMKGSENSSTENVNLDRKIENFMQTRFTEIIYSTDSKNDVLNNGDDESSSIMMISFLLQQFHHLQQHHHHFH